ncbi:MAG: alpha/beta hydrolase [Bacteroidales bacterium]|nr:alpha/beta hydrolase [Bacteroidales bacterium]
MYRITMTIILALIWINLNAQNQTKKNDFLITDDSTMLFVTKSGSGPICIFIHGGPGAWSKSFEDMKGNNLETNLSMVYYDQRGCGRSGKSINGNYSVDRMIKDIDLIRKHYHINKVYLLSHSFGGILAVNYALKYPNHVKGLILANSTLNIRKSLENQINYINSLLKTNFTISDSTSTSVMLTFLNAKKVLSAKRMSYKMLSDNKKTVDLLEKIDSKNSSDYDFAQKAFQIDDYWKDYTKITKQIDVPVLIITGKRDHSVGEEHYLLFNFKNENVRKIDGGHLLYFENNKEFINSIFRFIKETNK